MSERKRDVSERERDGQTEKEGWKERRGKDKHLRKFRPGREMV